MPLKVIGAGLGRTGTMSLKHALEQLGFGRCYHMTELARNRAAWPLWERAFDGMPVDWEQIFEGYGATTDLPGCFFYKELAERYPEAKVILTIRDPDSWFESMQSTMMAAEYQQKIRQSLIGGLMAKLWAYLARKYSSSEASVSPPPSTMQDRAVAIARFNTHNAEVRRTIPPERLLVFEVAQGWGPLCRFLGVPAPDAPFPHLNEPGKWQSILPEVMKERAS